MKRKISFFCHKFSALLLLFGGLNFSMMAHTCHIMEPKDPILFIYDASGSMWGQINGVTKKEIGAKVLTEAVHKLPDGQFIGMMVYGHRNEKECDDIELMVGLDNISKENIATALNGIMPLGRTPLARSAGLAINSVKKNGKAATIILITDGIESCDGDLCEVVSSARLQGIDFKMHIVGFGLKDEGTEMLQCAVDASGGKYFNAEDADQLSAALEQVTAQTINDPLENFSIMAIKNNEPVDALVKVYKAGTHKAIVGSRTYRDTGWMYLPPGQFEIEIRALENTDIAPKKIQIEIKNGEILHRTISFDGSTLDVMSTNNGEGWDSVVKVYKSGTDGVVASTRTYGRTKKLEVDPGTYDIQFQALTIKGQENVHRMEKIEVEAGQVKVVLHPFQSGRALIGVETTNGELIDATVGFTEVSSGKTITGSRTYASETSNPREFILSPGNYIVKVNALGKHAGLVSNLELSIKPGETIEKTITY